MKRNAFTLIELLVVISIIALLIAILLPALSAARESARANACQSGLHQMGIGMYAYLADNKNIFPGVSVQENWTTVENPNDAGWLSRGTTYQQIWDNAPTEGRIYDYVKSQEFFLCPSLDVGEPNFSGSAAVGRVSNGRYDYCMLTLLAGAQRDSVNEQARLQGENTLLPLIVEEDPAQWINNTHLDSAHGFDDRTAFTHNEQANYLAIGGSVQTVAGGMQVDTDWEVYRQGKWLKIPRKNDYDWYKTLK